MAAILSALETVSYRHGGYAVPSSHIHDHDEDVCINIHDEVMMATFLAVQDSSIGDLVTHSLINSLTF